MWAAAVRPVSLTLAAACLGMAIGFYPAGPPKGDDAPDAPSGHGLRAYVLTATLGGLALGFFAWAGRGKPDRPGGESEPCPSGLPAPAAYYPLE